MINQLWGLRCLELPPDHMWSLFSTCCRMEKSMTPLMSVSFRLVFSWSCCSTRQGNLSCKFLYQPDSCTPDPIKGHTLSYMFCLGRSISTNQHQARNWIRCASLDLEQRLAGQIVLKDWVETLWALGISRSCLAQPSGQQTQFLQVLWWLCELWSLLVGGRGVRTFYLV